MFLKVENRLDIVRDKNNSAVLNIDTKGLMAYKARREKEKRIDEMDREIRSMRGDLEEIKTLLHKFLESK